MKVERFPVEPVLRFPRGNLSRRAGFRGNIENERQIGPEPAGRELVDALDLLDAQAAGTALVRQRRVEDAVGDHDLSVVECRPDHLGHELGPGGGEQQRLRALVDLDLGILQQLADALAYRGSARLAHRDGALAERLAEEARLGGLARAVDSLERDEQAGHDCERSVGSRR